MPLPHPRRNSALGKLSYNQNDSRPHESLG